MKNPINLFHVSRWGMALVLLSGVVFCAFGISLSAVEWDYEWQIADGAPEIAGWQLLGDNHNGGIRDEGYLLTGNTHLTKPWDVKSSNAWTVTFRARRVDDGQDYGALFSVNDGVSQVDLNYYGHYKYRFQSQDGLQYRDVPGKPNTAFHDILIANDNGEVSIYVDGNDVPFVQYSAAKSSSLNGAMLLGDFSSGEPESMIESIRFTQSGAFKPSDFATSAFGPGASLQLPGGAAHPNRKLWWGTPSYSYGAPVIGNEQLAANGINFMLHLVYWSNYEPAASQYNEDFLNKLERQIVDLRKTGIHSSIRLGDARPGYAIWPKAVRQEFNKLSARNVGAYPAQADTDEKYFFYIRELVGRLKGKVDFYVLGDEYDMIYGANPDHPDTLRQYYDFFCKTSEVIREVDPEAKTVVFAFAWGAGVTYNTMKKMTEWGLGEYANGVAVNVPYGYSYNSDYLRGIAKNIHDLSSRYELYANGFGYVSDTMTQGAQAVRLAQLMVSLWLSEWSYNPYYLPDTIQKPWSSGIWTVDARADRVSYREASTPFRILSDKFYQKPSSEGDGFIAQSLSLGGVQFSPEALQSATFNAYWSQEGERGLGVVQLSPYSTQLKLIGNFLLKSAILPAGFELEQLRAIDLVTGKTVPLGARWLGEDVVFQCPVSANPVLLEIATEGV